MLRSLKGCPHQCPAVLSFRSLGQEAVLQKSTQPRMASRPFRGALFKRMMPCVNYGHTFYWQVGPVISVLTDSFSHPGFWQFIFVSHSQCSFCDPRRGKLFFCCGGRGSMVRKKKKWPLESHRTRCESYLPCQRDLDNLLAIFLNSKIGQ